MDEQSRAAIAQIFEEWQRRYQADPASFQPNPMEPKTYGEQAADTFIQIGSELGVIK